MRNDRILHSGGNLHAGVNDCTKASSELVEQVLLVNAKCEKFGRRRRAITFGVEVRLLASGYASQINPSFAAL